jgi:4-amino-4-deoxy-L-arabinose transferase-like glycosyltransferase
VSQGDIAVDDGRDRAAPHTDGPVRRRGWLPTERGDLLGWLTTAAVAAATLLSVVRAFGPMTYAGDIWRQSDTATIARNFYEHGMHLFDPQIDWGGAGPGYVETEFQLLPYLAASLYHVFGEQPALGRLVSVAFMLVAAAAFWHLADRFLPRTAARWALIAFVVSPAFMTYASAFMPDATALAFYVLALAAFERWLATDRGWWLVGTAAATAMACLVKPTSLHILLLLLIWTLLQARDRLKRPLLYVAAILAVVPAAIWMWHARSLFLEYGNTFGVLSGGDTKVGAFEAWLTPQFYLGNLRIEATLVYGVVGVPLALFGAWRARGRGTPYLIAAAITLPIFYALVPRYSAELGPHYHLFSLPLAALLIGIGVVALADLPGLRTLRAGWRQAGALVLAGLLAASSLLVFAQSMRDRSGTYGTCAAALASLTGPDELSVVATDSLAVQDGTPNNFQEPVIFYMADRRGWVLAADQQDPALVESYARQGARYLVARDEALVPADGALGRWLATDATVVRTPAADGCQVWELPRS